MSNYNSLFNFIRAHNGESAALADIPCGEPDFNCKLSGVFPHSIILALTVYENMEIHLSAGKLKGNWEFTTSRLYSVSYFRRLNLKRIELVAYTAQDDAYRIEVEL